MGSPQTNVRRPLPYLGREVAARRFLAPGGIDHLGALPLPSLPLPLDVLALKQAP